MTAEATVRISYLGYPILVTERTLTILSPQGRQVYRGDCELSTAMRVIRGYRAAENQKPTAPLAKTTAGSQKEGA